MKYHPDKNPDPAAVEIFHQLSKALEVLTDDAAKVGDVSARIHMTQQQVNKLPIKDSFCYLYTFIKTSLNK